MKGEFVRFRARVVGQKNSQVVGEDTNRTSSPFATLNSIKISLSPTKYIKKWDEKTEFIHGKIRKIVSIRVSDGVEPQAKTVRPEQVSGRLVIHDHKLFFQAVWFPSLCEVPLYLVKKVGDDYINISLGEDDLLIAADPEEQINAVKNQIK
ncbi:hypothetical protein PsorP6_015201 [Peronosclerospora sorghi]|uniref:Uncharacterized protein n=1 Tax=Peronosclerospora sorghi TaxID=230839 RepID=A0ACC0VU90_9STRA|nr:hypothetical protein PsorP6_015201 [Peronosclerospora sorghi]